ncbi:hypothetical protein Ahy_B05g076448 [Arachis hypogaea]|uniref:Uncharacterized protein n=1 Tax=Arachis hypogaea TaxID=3818 RepID=A0A444Z370_ARAHY|nr:hypothetical protein Ahy_B05g076448 [Arachis hypogaea]
MYKVAEGKEPENWLLLRSNSLRESKSLNSSGTVPVNLLLLRWKRDMSMNKDSSLTRVPWRFAWLRSMPATTGNADADAPILSSVKSQKTPL